MRRHFASRLLGLIAIVAPFGPGGCAEHAAEEAAPGPLAPPCETGGVVFEETGTYLPRAEPPSERQLGEIEGVAVIGGTLYLARGAILGAVPVDRISGAAHVTEIWRSGRPDVTPSGPRAHGHDLLWFAENDDYRLPLELWRASAGVAPTLLAVPADAVAIDGPTVFVADGSDLDSEQVVIRSGTAAASLSEVARLEGWSSGRGLLAQDRDALYVSTRSNQYTGAGVFRVAKADGAVTTLLTQTEGKGCTLIATDEGPDVFAACVSRRSASKGDPGDYELVRVAKSGGARTVVGPIKPPVSEQINFPVYKEGRWVHGVTWPGTAIVALDLESGVQRDVVRPNVGRLTAFTKDGSCIYWATRECRCSEMDERIGVCVAEECTNRIERTRQPEPSEP